MVQYLILIGFVFFMAFGKPAFAANPAANNVRLSVDDLPKLVQEKNQNVTGSQMLTQSAQARTGHLVRSFLPTLRGEIGGETFQTGAYSTKSQPYGSAEIRVNLFRGGKDYLEEHAREGQVVVSEGVAKKNFETELFQARKLYWEIVFTREMVKTVNAAIEQNERQLEMANRRIARGLTSETDRLEFQIHRSQLKEEVESLSHGLLLLQIALSAPLGMQQDTRFETEDAVPHVHDEVLLASKFDSQSHPEVSILRANQDISHFQKSQANRWWMPSVDVYGGYYLYTLRDRDYLNQGLRDDQVVGLRLSLELFDGLQSRSNAAAFSLQADGYESQAVQKARAVQAQIEVAKEDLKHDHELIHHSEERIEQGKKYLARTLEEYVRGVKNSLDVLGAAQRYVTFQRQYAERRRNYQVTKSGLQALLGQ